MKKTKNLLNIGIILFIVSVLILYILHSSYILYIPNPLQKISEKEYCEKDSDCAPERLCHATKVVNKKYVLPLENETGCTLDCETILDCGRAKPVCRYNKCVIQRVIRN